MHCHRGFCFLIILFACAVFYHRVSGQSVRFEHLTIEDGLSSGSIRAICQDSSGFIWIGTTDGLNRFDGLSLRVFNQIPGDTTSLSSNFIYRLLVDRKGNLWIGTLDGLNYYDRHSGKFRKVNLHKAAPNAPKKLEIFAIAADADNHIWVSTSHTGGLFKVQFTEINHTPVFVSSFIRATDSFNGTTINDYILCIYFGKDNRGYAGFDDGLFSFEKNKGRWKFINLFADKTPKPETPFTVESITEDPADSLAILSVLRSGSIFRISDAGNRSATRITPFYKPAEPAMEILSLTKDQNGNFWFGTNGTGLMRFTYGNNLIGEQFSIQHRYLNNPLQPGSLINNQVFTLCEDRSGLIWAGTDLGISIYNPNKENLSVTELFSDKPETPVSVSAIYLNRELLFTGTDGNGMIIKNKLLKTNTVITRNSENASKLGSNFITVFLKDKNENFWIGTLNGLSILPENEVQKLIRFSGDDASSVLKFTTLRPVKDDTASLSGRMIFALMEDRSGFIWAGTALGLNCIDPKTQKVVRSLKDDGSTQLRISNNIIRSLLEDTDQNIWIGTEDGLNRINSKTKDVTTYVNQSGNPNSLSGNRISFMIQTLDSTLWIGTNGAGLNRYNPKTRSFKHYTTANGLPNNVIHSIIDDRAGSLWLSTNNGISRFNMLTETFINYDVNDGLKSNSFNQGAAFRTSDGEIFFGSINGINSFYPERLNKNPFTPPIVITDFRIFDNSLFDGHYPAKFQSLINKNFIELSSNENFFSFEFAALSYINPAKNQFKYKLEGLNNDWVNNGNRRYVSFTNMNPGDYVFHVTGSNNDGIWNPEGIKIALRINPPWHKTWIAKLTALVLASFFIYLIVFMRIQTVRKEKEREFASRSAKIKQQFLANMSHEIRTPMNSIVGMTRLLRAKNPREDQKKYLDAINHSSNHLLVIINDILDYSKIEEGKMKLELAAFNVRNMMNDLYESFQLRAEEKKIDFSCSVADNVPVALIGDQVRISEVLINLVGNAIKFTQEGSVRVDCMNMGNYLDANGKIIPDVKCIRFTVSDSGIGISESQIENIFESFSQSNEHSHRKFGGTGLGLTISRQLVELHGGKISVRSKQGIGSVFSFTIPFEVADSSAIRSPEIKPSGLATALSKMKILLVEDNELNQIVAIDTLQFYQPGISVDVAANGKEGIEKIKSKNYDVVLMDIQMPVMDGFEAVQVIRNELPPPKNKTVIIAMTAGALKSEAERCLNAGMDDYIAKPFDPAMLMDKLSFYCKPISRKNS